MQNRSFLFVAALLAFVFLGGPQALATPEDSLFNLSANWQDNTGKAQDFSDLGDGRHKVVTMIFTSCPSACPLMVKHLEKLDKALDAKQKKNVEYLLFSIDPSDQVEQLKAFHQKFSLDERFRFLRAENENDIQTLAAVLGFKYKKIDENMYSHGTDVYLLNPEGQMIGKVGQSYKADDLAKKIPQ